MCLLLSQIRLLAHSRCSTNMQPSLYSLFSSRVMDRSEVKHFLRELRGVPHLGQEEDLSPTGSCV